MEFSFILRFELKEGPEPDRLVKRLAEAGCSDALMGTDAPDGLALRFTREANGAMAAVMDVLANLKSVIPHAQLLELSPAFSGHSASATQVVAATLWLLAQPSQRLVTALQGSPVRPTEEVEEIRVSNRYLAGIASPRAAMVRAAKAGINTFHGKGSCAGR
jgi:hypothetical protein